MKTIFKKALLLLMLGGSMASFSSCESFLDMQETEVLTFEKIWQQRSTTLQYLTRVYSYVQQEDAPNSTPWTGASDEGSCSWSTSGYPFSKINNGSWGPSNAAGDTYTHYYQGIREANTFMQNVESVTAFDVTQDEIQDWKNEARFLRAFFYAQLLRQYGPVILLGDQIIPADADLADLQLPRNTWDECVEYVCSELEETAKLLPARYTEANYYGKPTNVAALSIIARMRLYSARELFNGGNQNYLNLKNPDGTQIFPNYDANKWKLAAEAGRRAIDAIEDNGYGLYLADSDGNEVESGGAIDPHRSIHGLFYEAWNDEMIWSRYLGSWDWGNHTRPRVFAGGYGGLGPTQQHVDSYAMANGYYPIVGYNGDEYFMNQNNKTAGGNGITGKPTGGEPTIDPRSGYNESGFSSFANPALSVNDAGAATTGWNMYKEREPRFYAHISWNNTKYFQTPNTVIQYHQGGNTGNQHHDHPWTGYMGRKMGNYTVNASSASWPRYNWPIIRVAEVYLNYIEALVETGTNDYELFMYLNMIRERAGVPAIKDEIYVSEVNDKNYLRELVRRERKIELTWENHRYFDTRQWMIAETTDGGPIYGMNLYATSSNYTLDGETFWKRTVIQTRVFQPQHYLHPFTQRELDRNDNLVQNYGW